jgi:tRNA wybutosine-synthesizing protein 3
MDLFEQFKTSAMNGYNEAKIKGLADKDIIRHIDKFNKLKDYYTTSSCSGRIMLVKNIKGANKTPNAFYFKSHSSVDLKDFIKAIEDYKDSQEIWIKLNRSYFTLDVGIGCCKKLLDYCQLKGLKRAE